MSENKIEDLVSVASNVKSEEAYSNLFTALHNVELFLKMDDKAELISLMKLDDDKEAVLFFTSRDNPRLKKPYGGIVWKKGLEMVLNVPNVFGLVIQNNNMDWVAINKSKIKSLLNKL